MDELVFFNDQIIPLADASLSALSSFALSGKSVFTTVAIYNSKPFLWEKHWQRLTANSQKLGIDLSNWTEFEVKKSLIELIHHNRVFNGRARLNFFSEKPGRIWSFSTDKQTSFLISTGNLREVSAEINLTVSPFLINSTSPLANTKSGNYLEPLMAWEEASSRGYTEALRLNEKGEIVSGCLANIFWIREKEIFTPEISTGCLAGTVRSLILENFPVQEIKAPAEVLAKCESVFLSSSGIGLRRVGDFENRRYQENEIFDGLKTFYRRKAEDN